MAQQLRAIKRRIQSVRSTQKITNAMELIASSRVIRAQQRVEAARRRLEESSDGLERVATTCGFGGAEVMRRAFVRNIRVSPSDYRSRFRSSRRHDGQWPALQKKGA